MVDDKDEPDRNSPGSKGNGKDPGEFEMRILEEEDASSQEASSGVDELTGLEKQYQDLKRERDDMYERLLRKQADFENFRKRAEKEKREFQSYALSEFVLELIPILDNFERALAHGDEQSSVDYRKGVELIYRQLRDLLEKRGLKAIDAKGQTFDPNFHEAVMREERNDLPDNTILEELQKGYFFRDKLLRPAMVKVSHRTSEDDEPVIEVID